MKKFLIKTIVSIALLPLFFSTGQVFSQNGNPFLTHFNLPAGISNQNWGFVQGENGLMYILNRKGIYSFDGLQWENMGISGRPIAFAFSGKLFFCSDKGVGYIERTKEGETRQNLVLESKGNNFFYKFKTINTGLLVVSPLTICRINTETGISIDTLYHESRPEVFISDFFQLNDEMYHVKNRALIYLNKSDGEYEMLAGLPMSEDMTFSFIHGSKVYFGSTSNRLYCFDGKTLSLFAINDQQYLNASILNGGKSVNDSTFALSTLNGGILLVNSNNGATINMLNYFNGLPDDEVLALGMDKDGGLWISHGMGISRADLRLPIKSFEGYPGLKGAILSCIDYDGVLYVGCSEGLFYLAEIRDYKAKDIIVKPNVQIVDDAPATQIERLQQSQSAVEEKKKIFIARLFSRQSDKVADDEDDDRSVMTVLIQKKSEIPPQKKRIYELQSISHSYKQISGVKGKVRNLIIYEGSVLAATNLGLFEVKKEKATLVSPGFNITFIEPNEVNRNQLLIGTDERALIATKGATGWHYTELLTVDNQQIVSMVGLGNDSYVVSTEFDVIYIAKDEKNKFQSRIVTSIGAEFGSPVVRKVNGKIKIFTSGPVFDFDPNTDGLVVDTTYDTDQNTGIYFSQSGITWLNSRNSCICLSADGEELFSNTNYLSLFDNPNYINFSGDGELLLVNAFNQLFRLSVKKSEVSERTVTLFLKGVTGKSGIRLDPKKIELNYADNSLVITMSAPSFLREGATHYQYRIAGLTNRWSAMTTNPVFEFPYFPPGKYTISIRAMDVLGNNSETLNLPFEIKPPFWQTLWFYALCAIFVLLIFFLTVAIRERNLRREKEILEQKVKERTKTIEEQKEVLKQQRDDLVRYNEEILQQKEEIEAQRDEIETQRDQIFKQNDEITKSITYARRIQSAVMPSNELLGSIIGKYFLLFRPRDIVSGDFYWMSESDGIVLVAASDCTGHGVPGAFMSMMGVSFLNDIVNVAGIVRPDLILNELRQKIKANFRQTHGETEARDGMDIAICAFNFREKKLLFAGAYNPMYLVRKGQLTEYKGDKMPAGAHLKEVKFSLHEIDLERGDNIYIFSDGYVDQFGGDEGKKFMAKPFKDLLMSVYGKSMPEQQMVLEDTLDKWQAALDQVDDILVIGICID